MQSKNGTDGEAGKFVQQALVFVLDVGAAQPRALGVAEHILGIGIDPSSFTPVLNTEVQAHVYCATSGNASPTYSGIGAHSCSLELGGDESVLVGAERIIGVQM